jgi:hypothetical protein
MSVEDWAGIRRLHRSEGMPIARVMGVGRNTVRRALAAEGPPRYQRPARGSKVDAVEPQFRELLRLHHARVSIMSGHAGRSCLPITASISSAPHPPRRSYRVF